MRLKITHQTTYRYDRPVPYSLLQLRLTPRSGAGQQVLSWSSQMTGATRQVAYVDHFCNPVELVQMDEGATELHFSCTGEVEIENLNGVIGAGEGRMPLWVYRRPTPATEPGEAVRAIAARARPAVASDALGGAHALMAEVAEAVTWRKGTSTAATTAESAAKAGAGVCQDQAQVMIAAARLLGMPARYVSGYLLLGDRTDQEASHAWAEVWLEGLGWTGFDVANAICPDDRYVRVAVGCDYGDAAPVSGLRRGDAQEELYVSLQVQQ